MSNRKRIRISSIEITELDEKFMNTLKRNLKIVDHIHIPLQSGCDKTLKEMNRKYDTNYFYNKIEEIRKIRNNISFTTDLIVGFPNETEEDFNNTLQFLEKVNFTKIHVFPYSRRKGTPADNMPNQIDEQVKKERVRKVLELSKKLELKHMNNNLNKTLEVLIEKYEDGYIYGHTENYIEIKAKGNKEDISSLIKINIKSIEYPIMIGEKLSD